MSFCFYYKDDKYCTSWPIMDELCSILCDLGFDEQDSYLYEKEIDDDQAKKIKKALSTALLEGKLGGEMINYDSLGRRHREPWRVVTVNGKSPLTVDESKWIQGIIDFFDK